MVSTGDITGSVGNFGTVLPLLGAVALTCGMSLSLMILLCGGWYILSGILYKCPVSIEPLKAVAAISITLHLTPQVIAASGILIGIIFIIFGYLNGMKWVQNHIPSPVVRGVQLGLGFILLKSAFLDFGFVDFNLFVIGIIIIMALYLLRMIRQFPDFSAILLLFLGFGIVFYVNGLPQWSVPDLPVITLPTTPDFYNAGLNLVIPQIPVTIANSILATTLLLSDLYKCPISANRLSISVGLMSLSASILGGFPLCHGAGGVAAHYRFGGKTGFTMIIGGIVLIILAALFTNQALIHNFPQGLFGALLTVVAIEMVSLGMKTDNLLISGSMAIVALFGGMVYSLIIGIGVAVLSPYIISILKGDGHKT